MGDVRLLLDGAFDVPSPAKSQTFGVGCNGFRQKLERDIALEPRVARPVDLSHAARSKRGDDLVRPDAKTRTERHVWA